MRIFKKGFNYSQDGPGNRLVYHLQGCNFRCKWCANPESMDDHSPECRDYAVEELVREALGCAPMFFDGGGVTLTGGEPTVQFNETLALLRALKEAEINTAIETNGAHPRLDELLPYIDFLIMDVKHYDPVKHRYWTGDDGGRTRENLAHLCESGRRALIRIPVVRGVNLEPSEFARYFGSMDCRNLTFEPLAYHEFGKEKWTRPYEIKNGFVTDAEMSEFRLALQELGLVVVST